MQERPTAGWMPCWGDPPSGQHCQCCIIFPAVFWVLDTCDVFLLSSWTVKSSVFHFDSLKRTVQLASWLLRSVLILHLMKMALTGDQPQQAAALSIFTSRKCMGASCQTPRRIIKHILRSLFSFFRIPWSAEPTPQTASCSNATLCCTHTEMSQPPPNPAGTWNWALQSHVKLLLSF